MGGCHDDVISPLESPYTCYDGGCVGTSSIVGSSNISWT
jgi:hypothetical protein